MEFVPDEVTDSAYEIIEDMDLMTDVVSQTDKSEVVFVPPSMPRDQKISGSIVRYLENKGLVDNLVVSKHLFFGH